MAQGIVIRRANVPVPQQQAHRHSGGHALIDPAEHLHLIRFMPGGGERILGRTAQQLTADELLIHRQARGQPVKHRPHGRSMALTKNRHTDGISKGVFHIFFPIFL